MKVIIIVKLWLIHEEQCKENLPLILKTTRPLLQFHTFVILMGSSECQIPNATDSMEMCHQDACLQQAHAVILLPSLG